jgi:Tfp pilus assembly protein PilX
MPSDLRRARGRGGFVLILALVALLGAGALVAGLAFVARLDDGVSTAARDSQLALAAAELAAWRALAGLDNSHFGAVRGEELPVPVPAAHADSLRAVIVRLSDSLFVFTGEAAVRSTGGALLWRRVALFATGEGDSIGMVSATPLPHRSWAELQ